MMPMLPAMEVMRVRAFLVRRLRPLRRNAVQKVMLVLPRLPFFLFSSARTGGSAATSALPASSS